MPTRVGYVGVGAMGLAMAGHTKKAGNDVAVFDIDDAQMDKARSEGLETASGLEDLAAKADVFVVVVATDTQSAEVTRAIAEHAKEGSVIAVAATNRPDTMRDLQKDCAEHGVGFVDAPVVYGMPGARDGNLLSLCGGREDDFEKARPVLATYSRDVLRVGGIGAGQLAKACNNLLHWIHSIGNYEALLLAKRYGVDAQRMREVLLQAPARNGTLERWDSTRFTWQEKDMDVVLDLAQEGGLVLPLSGQTDQLIKLFHADHVAALLYGDEAPYLGRTIKPLSVDEGGFS